MKASKFLSPYISNRCRFTKKSPGVYMIKDDSVFSKIVYVGMAKKNVYDTLYRHFQTWNDKRFERTVYPKSGYWVRVIYCTASQVDKLERALIIKYKPNDNIDKYEHYSLLESDKKLISQSKKADFYNPLGEGVDVDF